MTRTMYDSVDPNTIPANPQVVAGYVDLNYRWPDSGWAKYAGIPRVRIAASPFTDDGHVYDFEPGNDMDPGHLVNWVGMRRRAGVAPAIYMDADHWPGVQQIFDNAGVPQPLYWVAHWGIDPVIPPGAIGLQYRSTPGYDVSVVADHWPSVDVALPVPPPPPVPAPFQPPPPAAPAVQPFEGRSEMIIVVAAPTDPHAPAGSDANPGIWLLSGSLYVHLLTPGEVTGLQNVGVPRIDVTNEQHVLFRNAAHGGTAVA